MVKSSNVVSMSPEPDYPLANSEATRMLAEGLERASEEKGLSQRQLAKTLNYKTSVVLSHMALGRVPIPIDRALDFARLLNMDASRFLLAVLEQRHPDIDFARVLGATAKTKTTGKGGRESYTLEELESIAGKDLDALPVDRINVLREVVGDQNAARRWLDLSEMPVIDTLRRMHPQGLTPAQRKKLEDAIANL